MLAPTIPVFFSHVHFVATSYIHGINIHYQQIFCMSARYQNVQKIKPINLDSKSVFSIALEDFVGEKSLTNYIEKKPKYVKPIDTPVYNEISGESGTVQYVPILHTLDVLLSHKDMLELVLESGKLNDDRLYNYCDGSLFPENNFFNENPNALQLILYHDDFTVVNPLGNKTIKYKMSAFYFQLGNIPHKYRSQLTDIHLLLVCHASMVKSFGYKAILKPLINDLKKL